MKKTMIAIAALSVLTAAGSVPEISMLDVSQPESASRRKVRVTYTLSGADAIVTAEVTTNGVPVPGCLANVEGDVNRLVTAGAGKMFTWDVRADWPDRKMDVSVKLKAWLSDRSPPDYMVVDLATGEKRFYASADDVPLTVADNVYKTDKMVMRLIPAAGVVWRMGQPVGGERCKGVNSGNTTTEENLRDNETPHLVAFTNDYYMGIYEVTQTQYKKVTGSNPSSMKSGTGRNDVTRFPVEKVSYEMLRGTASDGFSGWPQSGHALGAGAKLLLFREKTGIWSMDLPTEAQWEFACRAGTSSALNSGEECGDPISGRVDSRLDALGWYVGNAKIADARPEILYTGPREVGLKLSNAWGLYDMHGNVHEWCLDWLSLGDDYRATFVEDWARGGVTVDPVGASSGTMRVARGGDYFYSSAWARSSCRSGCQAVPSTESMHCGFRLVCSATLD